jgi:hypothetical protein
MFVCGVLIMAGLSRFLLLFHCGNRMACDEDTRLPVAVRSAVEQVTTRSWYCLNGHLCLPTEYQRNFKKLLLLQTSSMPAGARAATQQHVEV